MFLTEAAGSPGQLSGLPTVQVDAATTLLREGDVAATIFFIQQGCLRVGFNDDGKDVTTQFFLEGEAATSLESFIGQQPSLLTIEAIEPCRLQVLARQDFDQWMATDQLFSDWFHRTALQKLVAHTHRLLSFIKDKPAERYRQLAEQRPDLLRRIPQHYLASYLGITPVSLSRIKHRK